VSGTTERLWGLVAPYVEAEGIELDDLEVLGQGNGTIVRVTVDGPEAESGGRTTVGVDRIAALSRGLSRLLDAEDPVAGSYTLEVSSPGLERKLRRPSHYGKSLGREVKVKTHAPVEDARQHRGILTAHDAEGFTLEVDGSPRTIVYANVASARTVFEWEKAPKPGTRR
jgi:ribosome maturation factor RimP